MKERDEANRMGTELPGLVEERIAAELVCASLEEAGASLNALRPPTGRGRMWVLRGPMQCSVRRGAAAYDPLTIKTRRTF